MKRLILNFTVVLFSFILVSNLSAQSAATPPVDETIQTVEAYSVPNIFTPLSVANVKIVESQSANSGHVMDTVWRFVAAGMGHTAVIVPQTTLDDTSFFSTTDILIVSSGIINIPANRVNTIKSFIMRGKRVYIQSEYLSSYQSNIAFASIVTDLGGTFSWGSTVNGDLQPMTILGTLSTTPNSVPSIGYFWYGVYGSGNNTIEPFMRYGGNDFGFIFTPPNPNYGTVITDSDQDWVRAGTSLPLMQNILYRLAIVVGIEEIGGEVPESFRLHQNYPNPFNPGTVVGFELPVAGFVTLKVYDMLGREVETLVEEHLNSGTYEIEWNAGNYPSGVYYYTLSAGEFKQTRKMVLIK